MWNPPRTRVLFFSYHPHSLDGLSGTKACLFCFPEWKLIKSRDTSFITRGPTERSHSRRDVSYITTKPYVQKVICCAVLHPAVSSLTRHVKKNFISARTSLHPSFRSHLTTSLCASAFYWLLTVRPSRDVTLIKFWPSGLKESLAGRVTAPRARPTWVLMQRGMWLRNVHPFIWAISGANAS